MPRPHAPDPYPSTRRLAALLTAEPPPVADPAGIPAPHRETGVPGTPLGGGAHTADLAVVGAPDRERSEPAHALRRRARYGAQDPARPDEQEFSQVAGYDGDPERPGIPDPARRPHGPDRSDWSDWSDRSDWSNSPDGRDEPGGPDDPSGAGGTVGGRRDGPAVIELPSALRGARVGVTGRTLLGVALIVAALAAIVGARVWWADSRSEPVPVEAVAAPSVSGSQGAPGTPGAPGATDASAGAPGSPAGAGTPGMSAGPATADGPAGASGTAGGAATAAAGTVVVHVVGEVGRPGVTRVAAGARVADAVKRCGGLTAKADATSVNLARAVADGEQIVVRPRGATPAALATGPAPGGPSTAAAPGQAAGGGSAGSSGPAGGATQPLDLNSADAAALETLPGVGPVTAERIIEWRQANGRFGSVEELTEVQGIGEKTLERLRPHVRV